MIFLNMRRVTTAALVAALVVVPLGGCKTMETIQSKFGGEPTVELSPAEKQMRDDKSKFDSTVFGGVVAGAAMGALAGGLMAALGGGTTKDIQKGVLVGAVAGGVLGGVDGYATAKKQRVGNNEVRAIQATVADMQQENGRLEQFVRSADSVLAEGKQRLASLKSDTANGKITAQNAEAVRKREETNIALVKGTLDKSRELRTQYQQAGQRMSADPATRKNLDQEVAVMDRQVAQLERNLSEYNRALAVSRA